MATATTLTTKPNNGETTEQTPIQLTLSSGLATGDGDDHGLGFRGRRRLAPLPHSTDKKLLSPTESLKSVEPRSVGFEFGEHFYLGDTLEFILPDGSIQRGQDVIFTLPNNVQVTYGQINGLAGDFYATQYPICQGDTPQDRQSRFQAAFSTLAEGFPQTKNEVEKILSLMQAEVDAVNQAIHDHTDPSTVYATLPDLSVSFQLATLWRRLKLTGIPAYMGVSERNMDHFGRDAHEAWLAGHTVACQMAASGKTPANLMNAYAMNAFADHFLEDSFSAGHMRVPRRYCYAGGTTGNLCAKAGHKSHFPLSTTVLTKLKYMHDEDCALGLQVSNRKDMSWTAYGDKKLLDVVDRDNTRICLDALKESVQQVHDAWDSQTVPATLAMRSVLDWAPNLDLVDRDSRSMACMPLFTNRGERRANVNDRRSRALTTDWWWATTAFELTNSSRWSYPIAL